MNVDPVFAPAAHDKFFAMVVAPAAKNDPPRGMLAQRTPARRPKQALHQGRGSRPLHHDGRNRAPPRRGHEHDNGLWK